jgi:hypothetical protein
MTPSTSQHLPSYWLTATRAQAALSMCNAINSPGSLFFVDYLEDGDSKLLQNLRNNLPMNKASNTNLKSYAIWKFLK